MKLVYLRGEYCRNIVSIEANFSPHINIICGGNGSGKSTLLEMIYCLGRGRSFRTHVLTPMVQYQQNHSIIFGKLTDNTLTTSVGFKKHNQGKTEIKVGHLHNAPTLHTLSNLLPLQLFHPESHDFLNNGPILRRKFIDWGLFYTVPQFLSVWNRFHQVLKQRNAALNQKQEANYIHLWNEEIVDLGNQLSVYRSQYIVQLIEQAKPWLTRLLGRLPLDMSYHPGWDINKSLSSLLKSNFSKDIRYGYTTEGPHRFDLIIQSNGFSVEKTLSRGEQKRLICALYLTQGELFHQLTKKSCLYLLDDILSELDSTYQDKILDALMLLDAQVFVTSLDRGRVNTLHRKSNGQLFSIMKGVLSEY